MAVIALNKLAPLAAFLLCSLLITLDEAMANVVLIRNNESMQFPSTEASFAPRVRGSGVCGVILSGYPAHGCYPLSIKGASTDDSCSSFVLVTRGNCSFDTKVRHAQDAGFSAVIVSDDVENAELLTMAGNSVGIWIHAVFISKETGEVFTLYANDSKTECWILPSYENSAWLVMVISMTSLLAVAAVLATCFIIRQHRIRYSGSRSSRQRESYGMSSRAVNAMPSVIFKNQGNVNETVDTCAICLEDYMDGEKLRILPCCHRFHSSCIDAWLTMWRPFCPVCKQDARVDEVPPSEKTPLLSSTVSRQQVPPSLEESAPLSPPESPPIQIPPSSLDSNSGFLQGHSHTQNTHVSFHQPRSNASPMATPYASRHSSLQSLGVRGSSVLRNPDSIEAFRASPYFTPPSLSRNSSRCFLGSSSSPYSVGPNNEILIVLDSQCASPLNHSSFVESPLASSPYESTPPSSEGQSISQAYGMQRMGQYDA